MENDALPVNSQTEKLRFIRSPIHHNYNGNTQEGAGDTSRSSSNSGPLAPGSVTRPQNSRALERIGYKYRPEDTPWLRRNDDATNLEVFYDLFFACLNLFNRNQRMDSLTGLSSYAGFFSLMWTTWFVTSAYDVRFLTDSIFERLCRAVHLAVLIGFIVVSPNFDIARQDWGVFRSFAFTLMVSRLCLGLEYSVIFVQAWHYKSKWQVAALAGLNFMYGVLYVTISTRFGDDNDRLFVSLYIICAVEIVAVIMTAISYPILSFQGTPIIRRLSLLTLIIFGEGITIACTNVTDIIDADGPSGWTPQFWGTVVACIATTYLAFMLYFDSLHNFYLSTWRTHVWTILHFPLHLSLTLFTEGCAQFIVFWKSIEFEIKTAFEWSDLFEESIRPGNDDFSRAYRGWVDDFFDTQAPVFYTYRISMDDTLTELRGFNGSDRQALEDAWSTRNITVLEELVKANTVVRDTMESVYGMMYTCINVLFAQYGLDYYEDQISGRNITDTGASPDMLSTFDTSAGLSKRVYGRMRVAFQYTFVCAGGFLALLTVIACIGRSERWTRWAVVRVVINIFLALCVGCVAFLSQWDKPGDAFFRYLATPWVLPPFAILFFLLLVLHHLPEEKMSVRKPYRWVRGKLAARKGTGRRDGLREKRQGSESDHLRREDSDRISLERRASEDLEQGQKDGVGAGGRDNGIPRANEGERS